MLQKDHFHENHTKKILKLLRNSNVYNGLQIIRSVKETYDSNSYTS